VGQAYAKARALCQHIGDSPQLFQVLYGLWAFYLVRAELQTACELAERLLSMAQGQQDSVLVLKAHFALATALVLRGHLASARTHIEQSMTLCDLQHHSAQVSRDVAGMQVYGLIIAASILVELGYPDQALQRSDEALRLAQELSHPFTLAWALWKAAKLHQCRREEDATHERAETAIALSTAQGFPLLLAGSTFLQGWVLAAQGRGEEGIVQMRQGWAAWRSTGAEMDGPYLLAMLAEGYGRVGQVEAGLQVLADALALADTHGEHVNAAELYRLKGELLLALSADHHAEAATCFLQALDIARGQQAKWQELRTAMSLSRLWQRQGKRGAARQLLADVHDWFTEGFDTADLRDARTLLEALV
jgi:predicted ATPase